MASPEAKNLEAISKAIDQHNANCPFPAAEVRMNPFEVERLGWEHIRGLPVVPDGEIGTGRFRIVCSRDMEDDSLEITEAVGQELVTVEPAMAELGGCLHLPPPRRGKCRRHCSRPRWELQLWASMFSCLNSPVTIRIPITIRITPPTTTIAR